MAAITIQIVNLHIYEPYQKLPEHILTKTITDKISAHAERFRRGLISFVYWQAGI
jgi:hypothetical protein